MSNTPEQDPIGHAAKFLWLFAIIPVIFGSLAFFLPPEMSARTPGWARVMPFVLAALIALVGLGVRRRIVAAAWAGIGLFGAALVGTVYLAIAGGSKGRSGIILALLFAWPIKKLLDVTRAIRNEKGPAAGGPSPTG